MAVKKYTTEGQTFWCVDEWAWQSGKRTRFRKWRIPTQKAAEALAAKVRLESFEGRHFNKKKPAPTFTAAWELYRPHAESTKTSRHIAIRAKRLLSFFGNMPIDTITGVDIEKYRAQQRKRTTMRHSPPSPGTLDGDLLLLKAIANNASRKLDVDVQKLKRTRYLCQSKPRSGLINEAEFIRLLNASAKHLRPIITLAFDTGMRMREILRLTWDRVRLWEGKVLLEGQHTKTGEPRTVFLTKRAAASLMKLKDSGPYVFPSPFKPGQPIDYIYAAWDAAVERAGLHGLVFHDLRRSFVTQAVRAGVPESVVMKLSGHRTRAVFSRYHIVQEADLLDAVESISGQSAPARRLSRRRKTTTPIAEKATMVVGNPSAFLEGRDKLGRRSRWF